MRKPNLRRWRNLVCTMVLVVVVLGLLVHTGMGTLSSMGVGSLAAICPVGLLETLATGANLNLHAAVVLAVMMLVAVVLGRAFCAWICPTPHIQGFFRRNASATETEKVQDEEAGAQADAESGSEGSDGAGRFDGSPAACASCGGCGKALPPVGGARDGFHVDSRHMVLGGTLLSAAVFGFPVFCLLCPVGLTFATVIAVWYFFTGGEVTLGVLLFPLVIVVEVVLFRRWCKTLCPIGALLSLAARVGRKLARPRVDAAACLRTQGVDCRRCVEACPEQVDPHCGTIPECTRCGDCVAACPAEAIAFKLLPSDASVTAVLSDVSDASVSRS